jgi:hypothetical protein
VRVARQLSLFGVEAAAPAPEDLEGLLAGPGQVTRMGGTARVSVVVDELWRAQVLHAELRTRGLAVTCVSTVDDHLGVRTAYTAVLAPMATAWLRGAVKVPPPDFGLDGRRLRLWFAAAGDMSPVGGAEGPDRRSARDKLEFTLRLGANDELAWPAVGAALSAIGLPAALLSPRAGGPAYRITGRRRIARLAELVGDPPAAAPEGAWPVV